MTKEVYETLSPKEKLMYDEMHEFAKRFTERINEVCELLQAIIVMANDPPK
jgi:hypothetical protein